MNNLKLSHSHPKQQQRLLPLFYGPRMAKTMRILALSHPEIAEEIREELAKIQGARRRIRMLLARHRIAVRRVRVLCFPKQD